MLLRALDMTCLHLSVKKKGGTNESPGTIICVCLAWIGLHGPVVYGGGRCVWVDMRAMRDSCLRMVGLRAREGWRHWRGRGGGMRGAKMAIAMRSRPSHRENDHREELGHLWTRDLQRVINLHDSWV